MVLDTDAYNEIDDQFAISYMIKSKEKIHVKAICATPFYNAHSESPKDGMEKSYDEVLKLLSLMKENVDVFKGSEKYLDDEKSRSFPMRQKCWRNYLMNIHPKSRFMWW